LPQGFTPSCRNDGGPGACDIALRYQNTQRKRGDSRLDGRDVAIGDEDGDPLALQERFDGADENGVGGADDLFQNPASRRLRDVS
jgi:hypothetical protein